jgi:predicted HTH transcriptional regulator
MPAEVGEKTPEVGEKTDEVIAKPAEVIGNATEVKEKTAEVKEKTPEVGEKTPEVGEKTGVSDDVKAESVHVKPISDYVNHDFKVLMGAYRSDFRENARKVLYAFAESPEADIPSVARGLGFSTKSVWRAIRAMKEVGLLVREGGDKGGKWIVKNLKGDCHG